MPTVKHAHKNAADRKSGWPRMREVLQAAACQPTMTRAPASKEESSKLSRGRKRLSQNDRGAQGDEHRKHRGRAVVTAGASRRVSARDPLTCRAPGGGRPL